MSDWLQQRRNDPYFQRARDEGYRSRAAYKLKQINDRYHLIRGGDAVVDLGCAPGSWSQMAVQMVGGSGIVIGVDLQIVDPIPGVVLLQGDMMDAATEEALVSALGGRRPDVILSDMSPQITGNRLRDHLQSMALAERALELAMTHLRPEGAFVAKVFEGGDLPEFLRIVRSMFRFCKPHAPPASRKESSEIYVVAQRFQGR